MNSSNISKEILATLAQMVSDRDRLQIELTYSKSTISELEAQNREYHRLLSAAQEALLLIRPAKPAQTVSPDAQRIGGTWVSSLTTAALLSPAEAAWKSGKTQQALALLTPFFGQEHAHNIRIDAGLLRCAILRSSGDIAGALRHAEETLRLATNTCQHTLIGKAQFHRGLCCLYLNRYADAKWCFVLASHTEGHADLVEESLQMAIEKWEELAPGNPNRNLSPGFTEELRD